MFCLKIEVHVAVAHCRRKGDLMDKYSVNIDAAGTCRLHRATCTYVVNRQETELKGVGRVKRDGGWRDFATIAEAEQFCRERWPARKFKHCGVCHPKSYLPLGTRTRSAVLSARIVAPSSRSQPTAGLHDGASWMFFSATSARTPNGDS